MLITVGVLTLASAGIGYLTAFRKDEVNESVAMADERIPDADRTAALAGGDAASPADQPAERDRRPSGPVELAGGKVRPGPTGTPLRGRRP